MPVLAVDETLAPWGELKDIPWTGILVGNGASCAVWRGFQYKSLYDQSLSTGMTIRLTAEAARIFEALKTHNFELVLSALKTTSLVTQALGQNPATVDGLYLGIARTISSFVARDRSGSCRESHLLRQLAHSAVTRTLSTSKFVGGSFALYLMMRTRNASGSSARVPQASQQL
jgi:hypothetical protein